MGLSTRKLTRRGFLAGTAGALVAAPFLSAGQAGAAVPGGYDAAVLRDNPVGFWRMAGALAGNEPDASGHGLTGTYAGGRSLTTLPNGDGAAAFDGVNGCLEIPDNPLLSPATSGRFTIEAWIRPDVPNFVEIEGEEKRYVHWLGKGAPGQHEYVARMYNLDDLMRPNRISGYAFNPDGGRGAGSYTPDPVTVGAWIHYVLVINAADKDPIDFPNGYTEIYRNGAGPRDKRNLKIDDTVIVPEDKGAPLRVGTRDGNSWFEGAIGKVAVYDVALSPAQVLCHYNAMHP